MAPIVYCNRRFYATIMRNYIQLLLYICSYTSNSVFLSFIPQQGRFFKMILLVFYRIKAILGLLKCGRLSFLWKLCIVYHITSAVNIVILLLCS